MGSNIKYLKAEASHTPEMQSLLMKHGPNEWNYLPEEGVKAEMEDVASGRAIAVLAEAEEKIIGFAVAYPGLIRFPAIVDSRKDAGACGYIGDVVVHSDFAGKGIGSKLLNEAKSLLREAKVQEIHIDCHEENAASRGMMRKAGFRQLALFDDPDRRFAGSRKTWLGRCMG